ncbi:MAG: hypothetical protein IJH08_09865 [Atopobiaceae bacterium]|nr:hypothetical protein [Atopobiaceae bacterium]
MNPNDFALVRLADTGEGGMLNVTMVDKNDPSRRAVIVHDHDSGEFFDSVLKTGRKVEQLGERDAVRLLAVALSQVATKTGPAPV